MTDEKPPTYTTEDIWSQRARSRLGVSYDRRRLEGGIAVADTLLREYTRDAEAYTAACRARLDAIAEMVEQQVVAIRYDRRSFSCDYVVDVAVIPVVEGRRLSGVILTLPEHARRGTFIDGTWNGYGHARVRDVRDHALALARELGLPIWIAPDLPKKITFPKDCGVEVIRP